MGPPTLFIGLLSGTSVDGVDCALVDFKSTPPRLVATHVHPIPTRLKEQVFTLAVSGPDEIERMRALDFAFADLFSNAVLALCQKAGIDPKQVTAIGSHGQTIRHRPRQRFDGQLESIAPKPTL